ncbi:MAG: hypothetical protein LBK60_04715 [Verrucomicrobiales bacterium]|nr:hypothetical protein [Verrucomicrobiales bacterium]
MKAIAAFCLVILSLSAAATRAQVRLQLSQPRNLYLQYESIDLTVTLTNVTDASVNLGPDENGKPWLSFLVFAQDGGAVSQVKPVEVPPLTLAPDESKQVTVNILPCYGIRSTGGYSTQAIVQIPGLKPIMTGKLFLTIGKGETMWTQSIFNTGIKRIYSLIRFLDVDDSNLYLRVEEPDQNLLYTTIRLGRIVTFAEPVVQFDAHGHLHIVQVVGAKTYRYTEADASGVILYQEDRAEVPRLPRPTLAKTTDGEVQFIGGLTRQALAERAKLSETQE